MSKQLTLFSIVVPVYQNRDNLEDTVPKLLALEELLPCYTLELVLVDDGSTDGSRELVAAFPTRYPGRVRAVLLTRNFGQNASIQAGLRHARGRVIGVISCDLQEPHLKFVDMLSHWEQGSAFVIGERVDRRESWWHRKTSGLYWRLLRRHAFADYPPLGYDFCLIDRTVVDEVNRINECNASIFVLIYWLGFRPARVPVVRELRRAGRSQWNLGRKLAFTVDTLIGFTVLPARIITAAGFLTALAASCYLLYIVLRWATQHSAPPGWMTVVGLLILLGSMTLVALGILSEYLLRILDEVRNRPPFVVDRIVDTSAPKSG